MVNQVAHRFRAAEEDNEDIESEESDLDSIITDASPEISHTCLGDLLPKNPPSKTGISFGKKLVTSFGAITKIKRSVKGNRKQMEKFILDMAKEKPVRFSPKQINVFTGRFSNKLGVGGFGTVYKGEMPNGVQVAVKYLNVNFAEEQFMSELSILSRTHHRNLVTLIGFCLDVNIMALVYEYAENGSLDRALFDNCRRIDWEKLYRILTETAKGLSYLHEDCHQVIIHFDIKPANVLLDSNFSPMLADFGLAILHDRDKADEISVQPRGTLGYVSPEVCISSAATCKSDVYSFGMMLFEAISRARNLDATHFPNGPEWFPGRVWDAFEKGNLEQLLKEHAIEEKHIQQAKRMAMTALWCIQFAAENRPPMSTVVNILKGNSEPPKPPNPFLGWSSEQPERGVSSAFSSEINIDFTGNSEDFT